MCSGISRIFFTSFCTGPLNMLNIWKPILQRLGHKPHILHNAAEADCPKSVAFRCRCPFQGIVHNDKNCRGPVHQLPQIQQWPVVYGGLELSPVPPCGRELCSKYPDFFPGQLFLCHRELLEIFPDKLRRGSGVENAESFRYNFVINDNNLKILHVVGCRSPTAGFENLFHISWYYLSIGIE